MLKHRNDDAATLQINLSAGQLYVDGDPVIVWHVPIGTSQPPENERKAKLIAYLLAKKVTQMSAQSLSELQAQADQP